MSSKKKKSSTTRCDSCLNYFLSTDFEKHIGKIPTSGDVKGSPITSKNIPKVHNFTTCPQQSKNMRDILRIWNDSEICMQYLTPGIGMFVLVHYLEKRRESMPETLIGWEKQNFALIHPETMDQLEIVPRTPAIFVNDQFQQKIFTLWPCNEVPQFRVNICCENFSGKYVKALVVQPELIKDLSSLTLNLITVLPREYRQYLRQDKFFHLSYYLKSYLSQAYVCSKLTLTVHFYSKVLEFSIKNFTVANSAKKDLIEHALEKLNILGKEKSNEEKSDLINQTGKQNLYKIGTRTELEILLDDDSVAEDDDLR